MGEVEEEEGGDRGAAEEKALPDGDFPKLEASDYGANTPTSKGARRASLNAKGVWVNIKRIKKKSLREELVANSDGDLRKVASGHTHVCVLCWRLLVVTRDWKDRDGAFITSVPTNHNRKYHKDGAGKAAQAKTTASKPAKAGSGSKRLKTTPSFAVLVARQEVAAAKLALAEANLALAEGADADEDEAANATDGSADEDEALADVPGGKSAASAPLSRGSRSTAAVREQLAAALQEVEALRNAEEVEEEAAEEDEALPRCPERQPSTLVCL